MAAYTSGPAQQKRFYERLRDASAAGFYRSPLQDIPAVPSSDGIEISLGNSQRDNLRNNHTFGDSDDSEIDKEVPDFVDLSQDIEEPELLPLPPQQFSFEKDFSSTYHSHEYITPSKARTIIHHHPFHHWRQDQDQK
ncbi:Serine/threonine-protein kinase mTOR [Fusarium oxysporum f. sp. albedinis]|jgi:hypothetical protein|nr:Serine/threonine-protein kinase mTOR [Fusarium oxysporum f. sp. albedinis]KAK2469837.1 hypothetical protein H9L39_18652 [Fusarium oxysporum f. sp. albedinis]